MSSIEQGGVYWFDPRPSIGSEMHKIRPCVIVSPVEMNEHLQTLIVVPATSVLRPYPFRVTTTIAGTRASLACDQILTIDRSRLKGYIGTLSSPDLSKVMTVLSTILS